MKTELDLHQKQCFIIAPARYEDESCPELTIVDGSKYFCEKYNEAISKTERCEKCLKDKEN